MTEAAVEFILILVLALSSSQSHAFINLMMTSRSRSDVDNLPLLVTKGVDNHVLRGLFSETLRNRLGSLTRSHAGGPGRVSGTDREITAIDRYRQPAYPAEPAPIAISLIGPKKT